MEKKEAKQGKEENELDRIVGSEFDKLEQTLLKRPPQKGGGDARTAQHQIVVELPKKERPLDPEAEKLVSETIAWLSPRHDRELILARIRERLAEHPVGSRGEPADGGGLGAPERGEASGGATGPDQE